MVSDDPVDMLAARAKSDPRHRQRAAILMWTAIASFAIASVLAIITMQWRAAGDRGQIDSLQDQSACRSELAASMDVASAGLQIQIGRLTSSLIDPTDPRDLGQIGRDLLAASDELQIAADNRARTAELCT